MPPNEFTAVAPAHPSFVAIYNPSLGTTDETLHKQIVYHYSKSRRARVSRRESPGSNVAGDQTRVEDENERLRQIGLAQGMVNFAKWVVIHSPACHVCDLLRPPIEHFQVKSQSILLKRRSRGLYCVNLNRTGGYLQ